MNIYQIKNQFLNLQQLAEQGELDQETINDTLESLEFDFEEKAEGYGLVIANLSGHATALKAEAARLSEMAKSLDKNIDSMKEALQDAMIATGKTKFKTDHFSFGMRKSQAVLINDQSLIPSNFIKGKVTYVPDKEAIKEAINAGIKVTGASLVTNQSIQIK